MSAAFVLAAGGTGGHLFPAEALALELIASGGRVHLLTDSRADAFAMSLP
ncbi:MAG: glycosyltransferase, partial [Stellaceae bacterium]